jgi:hypothetical protein
MTLDTRRNTEAARAASNPQDKMRKRRDRVIHAKGRAQTEADFGLREWHEVRVLAPAVKNKARVWVPGQGGTYKTGKPFIFRFLPALSVNTESDTEEAAEFIPGRDPGSGELSVEMIRTIGFIDRFGSGDHQVSFIPTDVYETDEGYKPYNGPRDNPYALLVDGIRHAKAAGALPEKWQALGFTKKEIEAYLSANRISPPSGICRALLPMVNYRKFAYALIYAGYDSTARKEITSVRTPVGLNPKDGLQLVCLPNQAYDTLAHEYSLRARTEGKTDRNAFQCPEPAMEDKGCLNYVWNNKFPSPVTGEMSVNSLSGYTATADPYYYPNSDEPQEIDLTLPEKFTDWYYENWLPWDEILKGISGTEQAALLAEFFPELGPVCERFWDGHDDLMHAWSKASFSKADTDFNKLLIRNHTPRAQQSTAVRGVQINDSDRLSDEDYEDARPQREPIDPYDVYREEEEEEETPVRSRSSGAESDRPDDEPEEKPIRIRRSLAPKDGLPDESPEEKPVRKSPLKAVSDAVHQERAAVKPVRYEDSGEAADVDDEGFDDDEFID